MLEKEKIFDIVLAFDNHNNYSLVVIKSIINKTKARTKFHIFIPIGLDYSFHEDFLKSAAISFCVYRIDDIKFQDFKIDKIVYPHLTDAAFYRLAIANLISSKVDWFLYIDTDVYINFDIKDIFDYIDEDFTIIVSSMGKYFNSGVLLINRINMLKELPFEKAVEIQRLYNFPSDNELLAYFFKNKFKAISMVYNFQIQDYILNPKLLNDHMVKITDGKIIHFAGTTKPWRYSTTLPYTNEWRRVYFSIFGNNPWRKVSLQELTKKIIYKIFPNPRIILEILVKFRKKDI